MGDLRGPSVASDWSGQRQAIADFDWCRRHYFGPG
jgi:hypothetical protein